MQVSNSDISCGVDYIVDLSLKDFKVHLIDQGHKDRDGWGGYYSIRDPYFQKGYSYIFSDSVNNGNGQDIADFIKKHGLGSLIETRARLNPNSGNMIKIWIWRFNGKRNTDVKAKASRRVGRRT